GLETSKKRVHRRQSIRHMLPDFSGEPEGSHYFDAFAFCLTSSKKLNTNTNRRGDVAVAWSAIAANRSPSGWRASARPYEASGLVPAVRGDVHGTGFSTRNEAPDVESAATINRV